MDEAPVATTTMARVPSESLRKKRSSGSQDPLAEAMAASSSTSVSSPLSAARRGRASSAWASMRSWLARRMVPSQAYLMGLLLRLSVVVCVLGVLIGIGLGLRYTDDLPTAADYSNLVFDWQVNPRSYLTPYNQSFQYNILLDGHSHTNYSDGKMNPRQLLDWHIANGFNAVMVTDHNTLSGGQAAEQLALNDDYYRERIVVIPGMEYSCCRIHMNLIGINETIQVGPPVPTDQDLQAVINRTHALGGIVIVNHIPWSNTTQSGYDVARLPNHPSIEDLVAWGVDGFEVINQGTFDTISLAAAQQHNLIQMIGSDVHDPSVPVNAWLAVNSTMDKASILAEIVARRTSFLYDPTGTPQRAYPSMSAAYDRLSPLTLLGDYFSMFYSLNKGMYSFQGTFCQPEQFQVNADVIGWFLFWLILMIIVFELFRTMVLCAARAVTLYYQQWRARQRQHALSDF
ncbi:polymerase/histidinol phosphatase-like protein [Gongronella butleri]|nr:polymerase/histidinol phosphatase-like protein [Gongronella butleri]